MTRQRGARMWRAARIFKPAKGGGVKGSSMRIRFGYDICYCVAQATPMVFLLHAQPRADQRLLVPDTLMTAPELPVFIYRDAFGNTCARLVAPPGRIEIWTDALMEDSGVPERECHAAAEIPVQALPPDTLQFLMPSRYCESDLLLNEAWNAFGHLAPGWHRVQAICNLVNARIQFGYGFARTTKTALETYHERCGVCRDMAHLAIAFCRAMNIPARYCTSYLGDIGVPPVDAPMDFAACMEVFLGGEWHVFDPRNNQRRIGRLLIARGRDAADVAISTSFGQSALQHFRVHTDLADSTCLVDAA
jgi:transglutaminase-like putative cysteine protease